MLFEPLFELWCRCWYIQICHCLLSGTNFAYSYEYEHVYCALPAYCTSPAPSSHCTFEEFISQKVERKKAAHSHCSHLEPSLGLSDTGQADMKSSDCYVISDHGLRCKRSSSLTIWQSFSKSLYSTPEARDYQMYLYPMYLSS